MGSFAGNSAAFKVLLELLALEFSPFLVELTCEVGMCCPQQLIGCLFPVVQEFGLKQATCVHLGHKVVYLVVVGVCDPMVFTFYLAPVQLACKGGDMRFWSVDPFHDKVGFYIQLLLGGYKIIRDELGNQCLDGLVFVPYVILLEFFDALCVDVGNNGFDHQQVDHLLEGLYLPLDLLVRLELEELSTLGAVLDA